ncbi:hypothetical protein AVEN_18349-1 [Araneus ventricosus]|uniref:Histone-lysine N-methyltransferase SETMAR n=1 Tax=Araneus ventricosus TaxID=182803 RepID=A0A4Y2UMW0_ARAVE|nr:hypothetical protein AVEN_18349-1 [Araneus ventricosus]
MCSQVHIPTLQGIFVPIYVDLGPAVCPIEDQNTDTHTFSFTISRDIKNLDFTRLQRANLTSGVVLIHDNAHLHRAVVAQQLLEQFKWNVSDLPAYSPDLATSDFHLFSELTNWIGDQNFQENEEIQSKVKAHLTSLAATFFEERIENLVHRFNK